jgi:hypothetical protein
MTNNQTFKNLSLDLVWELYKLAAYTAAKKQLIDSGNLSDARELQDEASATAHGILTLSGRIQQESEKLGHTEFGKSVHSLLQQLPLRPDKSTEAALGRLEEALEDSTVATLRASVNTLHKARESEHVYRVASVTGLATIAAAGVGAPLAALITKEAIGTKILEAAVSTFTSVAFVEIGIETKDHLERHRSAPSTTTPLPRWLPGTVEPEPAYGPDHSRDVGPPMAPGTVEPEPAYGPDHSRDVAPPMAPGTVEPEPPYREKDHPSRRAERSPYRGRDVPGPHDIPGPHTGPGSAF